MSSWNLLMIFMNKCDAQIHVAFFPISGHSVERNAAAFAGTQQIRRWRKACAKRDFDIGKLGMHNSKLRVNIIKNQNWDVHIGGVLCTVILEIAYRVWFRPFPQAFNPPRKSSFCTLCTVVLAWGFEPFQNHGASWNCTFRYLGSIIRHDIPRIQLSTYVILKTTTNTSLYVTWQIIWPFLVGELMRHIRPWELLWE